MVGQPGFSDMDDRRKRSSDPGDQLEACAGASDFEIFRADIVKALAYSDGSHGARPPCDVVLMFRILIIQAQDNPGDDRAGFLIPDRLSFMRFPGFGLHDRVPDAKTIRVFRERLTRAGAIEGLFSRFDAALREAGYIAMSGRIVASPLVAAPGYATRLTGRRLSGWASPATRTGPMIRPKPGKKTWMHAGPSSSPQFVRARPREDGPAPPDIAIPSFGYKAHSGIDKRFRFIRRWDVTSAAADDGRMLRRGLLDCH